MKFLTYSILILNFLSFNLKAEEIFNPTQKEALGKIIDDHLMKNPEILVASLKLFEDTRVKEQEEKTKAYIRTNQAKIIGSPDDFVAGNPNAKATLVVFMDPFCIHCRAFHKTLEEALDLKQSGFKDFKIVFKDIPIFGESSDLAVRAMHAAKEQGKYIPFQKAMFDEDEPLSLETVLKIAASQGMDISKFSQDLDSEKTKSFVLATRQLAGDLGINGTPTSIIGENLVAGEIDLDSLKELIAQASKA